MPRIYTMCVPVTPNNDANDSDLDGEVDKTVMSLGKGDLNKTREEVVIEVAKAPERRVDNIITRCFQICARHCRFCFVNRALRCFQDFTTIPLLSKCMSKLVNGWDQREQTVFVKTRLTCLRLRYSSQIWSTYLTTAAVGTLGIASSGFCL
jgi:hypothetical protein